MVRNRDILLQELTELDFTITELVLYLDTHPNDANALNLYNKTVNKYQASKKYFEKLYGPITNDNIEDATAPWSWIKGPWPWELEANMNILVGQGKCTENTRNEVMQ